MVKELFIFSGLGVDERVFQRLDFSGYKTTFIKWIFPYNKETIEQYATRLIEQINSPKPILIGLSFGGMMAIEVAKQIETEKVIIIASAKTKNEIPFYYRIPGKLRLHKLIPHRLLKHSNFITNWIFGTESKFDKQLLKQIINDIDHSFLKWAIDKVVRWKNQTEIPNLFHIHGTSDRILPFCFVSANSIVKKGGHLMTLNKANELNNIIHLKLREK